MDRICRIRSLQRKIKKLKREMLRVKTQKKSRKPKKNIMGQILESCEQLARIQGRFNKKIFKEA